MLAQPFDQAHKTGVNQKNIRVEFSILFLEFKGRLLGRVGKDAAGMMLPLASLIVQHKNRLLRAGFSRIGTICGIGALRLLRRSRGGAVKIEYWHVVTPLSLIFVFKFRELHLRSAPRPLCLCNIPYFQICIFYG